jgi:hypothetical protein
MLHYLAAIILLTVIFWGLYKARVVPICPICAATVLTWAGGLALLYFKVPYASPVLIAILMGASLGALAEKYGKRFGLLWKSSVVIIGFPAIYFLVQKLWLDSLYFLAVAGFLTWLLQYRSGQAAHKPEKDLFKDCC